MGASGAESGERGVARRTVPREAGAPAAFVPRPSAIAASEAVGGGGDAVGRRAAPDPPGSADLPDPASWRASIDLVFRRIVAPGGGRAGRKTVLARRAHAGPLLVQRAFQPGDGACHVYLLHPPGGVAGGDRLDVRVRVERDASALLTTPAATKVYRSAQRSMVTHRLEVGAGASLEWLPQETILYGGSRVSVRTEVRLDPAARFASWEIAALGRPASGDAYAAGEARLETDVFVGGEPRLIERQRWRRGAAGPDTGTGTVTGRGTDDAVLGAAWGLAGRGVLAAFYAWPADGDTVERARTLLPEGRGCAATVVDGLLVVRMLADDATAARARLAEVWSGLRPSVSELPPCPPRIWAT